MSKLKQLEKLYPFLKKHKTGSEGLSLEGLPVEQLDLIAILNASQAISENILPEKLNEALIRIVMQQAGAGKGYLLFEYDGRLSVVSEAVLNKEIVVKVHDTPLEPDYKLLPEKIFQFVKRTGSTIIIDDALQDKVFGSDKYIQVARPRSIACLPIIKQEKHLGIIYLENNLIPGAFSADKIAVLKILTSQAAISIENAYYYREIKKLNETLEQRVKERTADLTKTQATLQLSEEKYRKIVEETGDAVYSSDYNGYLTYVNPICKKLTGYTENELVGKHFLEVIAPDWKEKVAKFYKEQFDNKVQETLFSFQIITKAGERKWIEQTVTQLKEGDWITGHNAIVRDITERKKAEEKLKEYQYFFTNSHDLITIASESHFEIINPNFQKVLGYSEKELLEKPFLDFVHPDDLDATLQEITKIKTGAETIDFTNRYRNKEGTYLWFEWNANYDSVTRKFYASARDITERKKAEDALKESEEKYHTLFDSIDQGYCIIEMIFDEYKKPIDYRFLEINAAFERQTGLRDAVGKRIREFAPNYEEYWFEIYGKIALTGESVRFENRAEQLHRWYDVYAYSLGEPKNLQVAILFNDITERKKAEDELKNSNERFLKIFENNSFGMVLVNLETNKFQYVNGYFLEKFGYTSEEVIGKTATELTIIEPESYEKVITLFKQQGYVTDYEALVRKKNGELFWSSSSLQVIKIKDVNFFLSSFFDITDRKKADEIIKQKSEELVNTNKELEQFAYVASHDLQEPLRTISSFIVLLEKTYSGKTDKDTELYFKFILTATSKMKNLIKDLLDFSRVGKSISFEPTDCNKILKEVIADLDLSIKESNAKITAAILPVLLGNGTELKRLFQNLISNAIKFRKKNVIPEIAITVEEKDTEYLFSIKDNGIGIEEQYFAKLFIIFQRLHTIEEYPGTGIGLATCKKIVTLHKGKIWVESKLGEGSTFYFSILKNLK